MSLSLEILKGLTEMVEESIKIRPSIKVLVSGLISQRDENANEKSVFRDGFCIV